MTRLGAHRRRVAATGGQAPWTDEPSASPGGSPDATGRAGGLGPAARPAGLLTSKLVMPVPRWRPVHRPRLHRLLEDGTRGPLTLLAAPPGSGKTVLLASWAAGGGAPGPVAWVTADPGDADPARLWAHVLAALRRTGALPAGGVLAGMDPPSDTGERFLALLVNGLAELPEPVVLVLDDLHEAGGAAVAAGLRFLLRHAPPQLRLVLVSRADVAISLQRLRLAGQLTEIRASDLAFTPGEARELFAGLGLALLDADLESLCRRTEGWAAGLRLAALSLRGHPDPGRFVTEFAGDDRAVAGYLVEEVLACQAPEVQEFLLRTSVADRLCGGLADTLTGRSDGERMLARLEREHTFTTALGPSRSWYRYHPLFAELLRAELRHAQPELLPELHRRAAGWYAANGLPADAVGHALAGDDAGQAYHLLVGFWSARLSAPPPTTGRDLLARLPADQVRGPGLLAAGSRRQALALISLGAAELWCDQFQDAHPHLEEGRALAARTGQDAMAVTATGHLALLEAIAGNLTRAARLARAATDLAARRGLSGGPAAACAELALALVHYWRDDLGGATQALERAARAAGDGGDRHVALALAIAEARLAAGRGGDGLGGALADLRAALPANTGWQPPRLLAGAARRAEARLLLAAGDLEATGALLAPTAADGRRAAAEAVLAARLWLARGDPAGAGRVLAPHLGGRDPRPRLPVLIEARMLDAVAQHEPAGPAAAAALERALGLAAPEGHRRVFVEGGPLVWALLSDHLRRDTEHRALIGVLLDALAPAAGPGGPRRDGDTTVGPLEPLSQRERVVLRYLPSLLSAGEIAAELYVSVNTVKTHIRSIYRKLDANRRMDAVRRARQLELL
jgi:LuxR family maltose regulon positive regulatory protein